MTIASVNPATGQTLRTFTPLSEPELDARLQCAADAFGRYRRTPMAERTGMLLLAADILEAEKEKFGRLMVQEMGKTFRAAVEEAAKCAWGCRYYAEQAERFLADELVETSASRSYVTFQPLGPILAIMPWNFPFWQVVRFAAPALAAGNVALLKHASNVPQCALAIQDIFRRAGLAEGCFQTLLIETDRVRRVIDLVELTGKERHRPDQLSAGEQQRVAVARALVTRPSVLLADEPTGNLDYTNSGELLDALWRSCDEGSQTIVLVTHDARAAAYADRVLVIGDGRIQEEIALGRRADHSAAPLIARLAAVGL